MPIWVSDIVPIFLYSSKEVLFTLKYLLNTYIQAFIKRFSCSCFSHVHISHLFLIGNQTPFFEELPKESHHSPSNDSNCCNKGQIHRP